MATETTTGADEVPGRDSPGLLIDIGQLGGLLRRSVASLERDQAAGRLPAPVYVGGSRRWRRAEIEGWVAAGCPDRPRWEQTRGAGAASAPTGIGPRDQNRGFDVTGPSTQTADARPRPKRRRRLPPGLLRRASAARYCGVGCSTWDRLAAAGLTPAPIRLAGSVGWSRRELALWIDHGCPPRSEWAPLWQALLTARRTGRAK